MCFRHFVPFSSSPQTHTDTHPSFPMQQFGILSLEKKIKTWCTVCLALGCGQISGDTHLGKTISLPAPSKSFTPWLGGRRIMCPALLSILGFRLTWVLQVLHILSQLQWVPMFSFPAVYRCFLVSHWPPLLLILCSLFPQWSPNLEHGVCVCVCVTGGFSSCLAPQLKYLLLTTNCLAELRLIIN